VGHIGGDRPRLAGAEVARLLGDAEAERSGEDEAELLVLVPVLGDVRAGIELDDREREPLAVRDACGHRLPHLQVG
jgi:hypothetical protein